MIEEIATALPIVISFLLVLLLLPFWIRKAKQIGLIWDDMNKVNSPKVAGSGGIVVVMGFILGVFTYIAYRVFFLKTEDGFLVAILSLLTVVLFLAGVGMIDDLFGWQHGGLSKRSRLVLVAFSAVPLMAIKAGDSTISLPWGGELPLGLIYPLLFVPLGIVGSTTTFNFLAGFNGLEAGQGIILLTSLALVVYFSHTTWLAIVALCMIGALIAFLLYNWAPAKVFPGDSLTYSIGGLIAIMAILGNCERVAIFFFIPYILETFLKLRGGLKKYSFGKPTPDGFLEMRYERIYGLEHAAIFVLNKTGIRATERKVVALLWAFQIAIVIVGFIIFRQGIFGR